MKTEPMQSALGPLRDDGMRYYDSALDVVGRTPLVRLRRVMDGAPCMVLAKVEYEIRHHTPVVGHTPRIQPPPSLPCGSIL